MSVFDTFTDAVDERLATDPSYGKGTYGHAAVNMAYMLRCMETLPEKTRRTLLISQCRELLRRFGPEIIEHLRQDLQLLIEEEDLK